MAVKLAPNARRQFLNASGVPYSGAKLFYYAAGSTTKQNTYTTSAGSVANSNPILLDSAGRTPYGVWFTEGLTYKEVLAPPTDTDPPSSPIFTEDNLSGINDTNTTVSQWAASSLTPTYLNSTQFSVPGDQLTALHVGRRLQFSVTAGTVYGRISVSGYTSLTTVTVVMDAGQTLDSGLSSFNWSILTATSPALPKLSGTLWDGVGVVNNDSTQTVAGDKTFTGANTHSGTNAFSNAVTCTSTVNLSGAVLQGSTPLVFEGGTDNAFETSLVVTNPTADRTVTVPDADVDLTYVRQATDIAAGYAEKATDAETLGGADTTRYVTSAGLASGQSLVANGYSKYPGGRIEQWGVTAANVDIGAGGASVTINFPITFNTVHSIVISPYSNDAGAARSLVPAITGLSTTQATVQVFEGSAATQALWGLYYKVEGK